MDEVETRTPVKRDCYRYREHIFNSKLSCNSKSYSVIIRSIPESYLSTRSCIYGETAGLSQYEIIDSGEDKAIVYSKAKVGLKEVGTQRMLIGKFSSVCGTYTQCTGLCRSYCSESKRCYKDCNYFFHFKRFKLTFKYNYFLVKRKITRGSAIRLIVALTGRYTPKLQ